MKYLNKLLFLGIILVVTSINLMSQVSINGASYTTIKAAFDAINAGTHTGNIEVQITGNTTETATAVLKSSGNGEANYSSVTIYPTGTYTITGNLTYLLNFQGSDNVTIDGRVNKTGSTRALTLENTSTATSAVIKFDSTATDGGSKNNKVTYCKIVGGSIGSAYLLVFGGGTSATATGVGHDNNEISYNHFIKGYQGIRIYGTSATRNKSNIMHHNEFGTATNGEEVSYQPIYIYYTQNSEVYDNKFDYLRRTSTVYAMYIYYSSFAKIYNNSIQNASISSSFYAIYLGQSTENEVYNNTIKNNSATSSFYNIYLSSSGNSEVYNNIIEDNTSTGGLNYAIYLASSTNTSIENNIVKNLYGSSTVYGTYLTSSGSSSVYNNTYTNLTSAISTLAVIYFNSSTSCLAAGNTAKNISSSSTCYGVFVASSGYSVVKNNKFETVEALNGDAYLVNLSSSGSSEISYNSFLGFKSSGMMYGIYNSTGTDCKIIGNLLSNLSSTGTAATGAYGIYIASGNNQIIANNAVAYIRSTNYSGTSLVNNPFGITLAGGTGHKVYFNSVNMSGDQLNVGASPSLSSAFLVSSTAVNGIDVRNNVFVNSLTGFAGSKGYSVYLTGSSNLTNSAVINYNDYYISGSQSIFGYYGANVNSLNDWKTSTLQDQNSVSINPAFNSAFIPSPAPGSQIVNIGTPISGYTTDIFGKTRSETNPSLGAYEFAEDIVGPDIIFNLLTSTTSTSNRLLVATITDYSGINSAINSPRIYYRKTTNSNTFNNNTASTDGWKFATASKNGDEYTFTIDYSKLYGGIQAGDKVEYFVVAMDNSENENLSANSGEFATMPQTTNLAANNFPFTATNNYEISFSLSGTYYVGLNQQFTSLTSAGGFFEYANKSVMTGDVNVLIASNTLETGAFQLGKLPEEYGQDWKLTIKPMNMGSYVLSGTYAGALFRFIGTNNLTIDGSTGLGGRFLEFTNNQASGTRVTIMIGSGGAAINGGKNITLKNIKITGNTPTTTTSIGLLISDASTSTSATSTDVNNLKIQNNEFYRLMYAMILNGTASNPMQDLLVEDNIIGSDNISDYIYQTGIDVDEAPNGMIRNNKIFNIIHTTGINKFGIQLDGSLPEGINVVGNTIHSIKYNGPSGYGAYGINILAGNNHVMINNMISDLITDKYSETSSTYNPFGIRITSGTGHKIWHNTINMSGNQEGTNSTPKGSLTAAICITSSAVNNLDVKGNIFINTLEGVTGTKSFIYYSSTTLVGKFAVLANNMTKFGTNQGAYAAWGTTKPFNESANLEAFQGTYSLDLTSVVGNPSFVNNYDLHLSGNLVGNPDYMIDKSYEIQTDKDGENRNADTYYGADELNPIFEIISDVSANPNQSVYCFLDNIELSMNAGVTGYQDGIKRMGGPSVGYAWFKNGEFIDLPSFNKLSLAAVTKADSADYYAKAYFMDKELTSSTIHIAVESPMVLTYDISDADVCNNNPILEIHAESEGTVTGYQWEKYNPNKSAWEDIVGANQSSLFIPLAEPEEAIGKYRGRIMGPGNCGPSTIYTSESNVFVTEPIINESVTVDFNPQAVCKGDYLVFQGNAEGTIYGYQWQVSKGASYENLPIEEYPTANTDRLIIDNALPEMSGKYRMVIYGSTACGDQFTTTNEIDLYVFPTFEIEDQPKEQATCVGEDVNLGIYANGQIISYQWFKNDKPISLEENANAQNQFIQFENVTFETSGNYYCLLTYADCSGIQTLKSHIAPIYVATSTEISHKPETQAAAVGSDVFFTFKAHINGLPETYEIPVQWYRGDEPLVDDGRIQGSRSQILHISNVQESDYREDYKLVLKGLCGNTEISDFGIVKVDLAIEQQPSAITQCEGTMAVFNVAANSTIGNDQITYQWFKDGLVLYNGARISGATSNKLVVSNISKDDAGDYYVKVGLKGASNTATSLPASMTVNPLPAFTLNLENEITINEDDLLELIVATSGENVKYQWYFDGIAIDGADEDVYIIDEVKPENAGEYYVTATNACGTIKSNVTTITVTPKSTTSAEDYLSFVNSLEGPTPHPVSSISEIKFNMNNSANVEVALVDINGKKLEVLFDGMANTGVNVLKLDVEKLNITSGTYLIVLTSNNQTITQTITVIK